MHCNYCNEKSAKQKWFFVVLDVGKKLLVKLLLIFVGLAEYILNNNEKLISKSDSIRIVREEDLIKSIYNITVTLSIQNKRTLICCLWVLFNSILCHYCNCF